MAVDLGVIGSQWIDNTCVYSSVDVYLAFKISVSVSAAIRMQSLLSVGSSSKSSWSKVATTTPGYFIIT